MKISDEKKASDEIIRYSRVYIPCPSPVYLYDECIKIINLIWLARW